MHSFLIPLWPFPALALFARLNTQAESVMLTFTRSIHPRHGAGLLGIAALGLLALSPSVAHAQSGPMGTPGTNGTTGATLSGSFTFNDPTTHDQGTGGGGGGLGGNGGPQGGQGGTGGTGGGGGTGLAATGTGAKITFQSGTFAGGRGGMGGNAGDPGAPAFFSFGGNGGAGGAGGAGFIAPGANDNVTVLGGTFSGGVGGTGGGGTIGTPGARNGGGGFGGAGGDAFDATGPGTNITIVGGTFNAGRGGVGGTGNGSIGGNDGNDFSAGTGVTASVYGGNFEFFPLGGEGVGGGGVSNPNGGPTVSFALNGSNVTVFGTFVTQYFGGTPITTPTTFTSGRGSFFGLLAANMGVGQQFSYSIANGGSLTLAPAPAVPEASTMVSFGLLLALSLGGMIVAARRKKQAA